MKYPHRSEAEQAALDRIDTTHYAFDDMPFLKTNRYSMSDEYELNDVLDKELIDHHGASDNLWGLNHNRERTNTV